MRKKLGILSLMRDFDAVSVRVSEFDTREIVLSHIFHYCDFLSPEPDSPIINFSWRSDSEAEVDLRESMVLVIEHQQVFSRWNIYDACMAQLVLEP